MAQRRTNNTLVFVIGVVTAVIGAALAGLWLLRDDGGETTASAGGGSVPVLVSRRPIPKGASGSQLADAVEVRHVPAITRSSDALSSVEQLVERTALTDIDEGQQVRSAFLRSRTVRAGAIAIPAGKQAVAVTVDFTAAGAGYIGPGDKVNVYALFDRAGDTVVVEGRTGAAPSNAPTVAADRLVLPGVEVLDVSQEVAPSTQAPQPQATGGATARPAGAATITYLLAVDADQAERLIFFTSYTRLYLTLVPADQPPSATGGRDQNNVLRG